MRFANPYLLWLLALLLPIIAYYIYRTLQGGAAIRFSSVAAARNVPRTLRYWLRHVPFVLRLAALAFVIVALARPQTVEDQSRTNAEGIDIMLSIDISGSMLARDFKPDRISAAKEVAASFVADGVGVRFLCDVSCRDEHCSSGSLQTPAFQFFPGQFQGVGTVGNGILSLLGHGGKGCCL